MIILIRHGEATHHTERLTGGWTNSVLTAKGREQVRRLAQQLRADFADRKKPRIYASDLLRARESAEIIAEALRVDRVELCEFLREKNNGIAANMTETMAKNYYRKPATDRELDHANYPGGETRREFFLRTVEGFRELDLTGGDIIIVSHKGAIQNIIFDWLGMDIGEVNERGFSVDVLPASLSVLGVNKWNEHAIFLLNTVVYPEQQKGFGLGKFIMKP